MEKRLAKIAAEIIEHGAWGTDFLNIAAHLNKSHNMNTDTLEIGKAWDMFLGQV